MKMGDSLGLDIVVYTTKASTTRSSYKYIDNESIYLLPFTRLIFVFVFFYRHTVNNYIRPRMTLQCVYCDFSNVKIVHEILM